MTAYIRIVTEAEVDRLAVENRQLKAENARLKQKVKQLQKAIGPVGPFGYRKSD